ncbi:PHP domain-containing protein [Halosegnis marinus]|uniref:PHP domain-containing protein n=1 Tax=Halosegnis marinus TaxID=3034023 RepID=A0ABD5ZNY0_9EURY|nr:PHP domain-containing protein [Halosegnis sp. DT85]
MDSPVVADLHAHTTNSDGEMALDDVPVAAKRAGVEVVAVTDHDRLHPDLDAPTEYREGVKLIHGIELRVESPAGRVDLLGYAAEPTMALERETERLQADRAQRGAAIIENVEDRLGIDLGIEARPGIGRPNIARAVAERTDMTVNEVFDDLIGDDGPCFVAREVPDFGTGRDLLADACGLVGLAHPFRYEDPAAALELCADLDAVERYYPYGREVEASLVEDAIDRYDLVPTGGSDAHDDELGKAGLDADGYERFRAAAGLPHP